MAVMMLMRSLQIQEYRDTWKQGYRDTEILGYSDTGIQGYWDTVIQGSGKQKYTIIGI